MRDILGVLIACTLSCCAASARPVFNGGFDLPVPSDGEGNGWRASMNDANGGWRASGGNPGGCFILNSSGEAGSDPAIQQRVDGLFLGFGYQILGEYTSAIHNDRPAGADAFVIDVSTSANGPWKPVLAASTTAIGAWTPFTAYFSADASSMWIRFRGETAGTDNDFKVDNIQAVAQAGISFAGVSASGFSTGQAQCPYPEFESSFFDDTTISFDFASGHGGTSGGLVGWAGHVGFIELFVDAAIAYPQPNHVELRVIVDGGASFVQPYNYVGECRATLSLNTPLNIDVSESLSGLPYHFGLETAGAFSGAALRRIVDGQVFPPGSRIHPGSYVLMESGSVSIGATHAQPYDTANDYLVATFVALPCTPPSIVASPTDLEICAGDGATFSVAATGSNLSYQWRGLNGDLQNDAIYSGVNTPTLTVSAVPAAAYAYHCVIANECASLRSQTALVRRVPGPSIAWDDFSYPPFPLRLCGLDPISTSMTVHVATSYPIHPVSLQWYRGEVPLVDGPTAHGSTIAGARTHTLFVHSVTPDDAGNLPHQRYRCMVSNPCGATSSLWGWINYCPVDVDCSSDVNSADFFAYLALFFDGRPEADLNRDGSVGSQDFFEFLQAFFNSCL
jgi:hypothetical protein